MGRSEYGHTVYQSGEPDPVAATCGRGLTEGAHLQNLEIIADRLNDLEPVLKETISTAVTIKVSRTYRPVVYNESDPLPTAYH
jgi:hypothetical protein